MEKELPKGWIEVPLGEVVNVKRGKKPISTSLEKKDGYIPYILIDEMEGKPVRQYTNDPNVSIVKENEVLIVWDGSIGKCSSGLKGAIGSTLVALEPLNNIPTKFLEYFLKERNQFIKETSTGTGLQHINKNFFKECIFQLPPPPEQKRIVSKLDGLFAHLEKIKKGLDETPIILKQFRQAVLTQAISGKLTEQWRQGKKLNYMKISEIDNFRRKKKEEFSISQGKKSFTYKKAPVPKLGENTKGIDEFFNLPKQWKWINLDTVTWNISDGPHFSPKYVTESEGKRFISMRNISQNGIDFSDCKFVSISDHKEFIKRGKPEKGDILYTKGGSTGIPCLVKEDTDFSYWVHVALVKPIHEAINCYYLKYTLESQLCYMQSQAFTHGVGNQDLGLTRMTKICFPLPSLEEQNEIVRRVETLFSKADVIEENYLKLKAQIDQLPQVILAKAFRGEL